MKKNLLQLFVIVFVVLLNNILIAQNKTVKTESTNITVGYLSKISLLNSGGNDWIKNSLIFDNGTNIGIGTSSPLSLFSVGSTSQFQVNSTGAISTATGITSSGTIRFSGLAANNVIMTTTGGQLTTGTVSVSQGGTGVTSLSGIIRGNGSNAFSAITGTTNYLPKWGNSTTLSGTSSIYDDGINVGIGTITPLAKLHVESSAFFGDGIGAGAWLGFDMIGGEIGLTDANDRIIAGILNGRYHYGGYNEGEGIVINPSNNYVGIGTSNPTANIDILGRGIGENVSIKMLAGSHLSPQILMGSNTILCRLAVAPLYGGGLTNEAMEGDVILRTEHPLQRLIMNSGAGASTLLVYNGNVGIKTYYPEHALHVNGNILVEGLNSTLLFGEDTHNNNASWGQWGIEYADADHGLNFWKPGGSNGGAGNYFLFLKDDGNIGIGTNNPGTYKLAVCGNIHAKEIVVETGWCDFVFAKGYKLKSLSELEKYIKENKHLPEIPSTVDVEKNGVNVGNMESLLLKKVEELTLYIIELNKQIQELKNKNSEIN